MVKLNEPTFVQVGDLAALSQNEIDLSVTTQVEQAKAALCQAEQAVGAYIGALDLIEHQVTVSTRIRRLKNNLEMDDGPVTTINSVQVGNDDPIDPSNLLIAGKGWVIFRNDDLLFPENTLINVDYLAGYKIDSAGVNTMPRMVQQAILMLAVNTFSNPITGLTEERIGDYAYTRGRQGDQQVAVPVEVQDLLLRFKRPRI
jgi:hypothetical protein